MNCIVTVDFPLPPDAQVIDPLPATDEEFVAVPTAPETIPDADDSLRVKLP
jgi:hypothetical protein